MSKVTILRKSHKLIIQLLKSNFMQNKAQVTHKLKTECTHFIESQLDIYSTSLTLIEDRQLPVYKAREEFSNSYSSSSPASLRAFDVSKKQVCLLKRGNFSINVVDSLKQRIKTNTLIEKMYASRGYRTESVTTFVHGLNQVIFAATIGEIIVGTVTLGIDSDQGLLADELYQEEVDSFRSADRIVCELSKFAMDPQYSTKEIIASLFQIAYIYARNVHKVTDFFCEVNPRHVAPQKRLFGFRKIGKLRSCPRVEAPAVLLHLELNYIKAQTIAFAESYKQEARSIYPHFLSQDEEEIIGKKIQHMLFAQKIHNNSHTESARFFQRLVSLSQAASADSSSWR